MPPSCFVNKLTINRRDLMISGISYKQQTMVKERRFLSE